MTRIREGDVLYVMFEELCRDGARLRLFDADAREAWRANCVSLLAAVPDPAQRVAWTMYFAQHLVAGIGIPIDLFGWIMKKEQA